jgi:uncharacterized membrane protein YheB (UPF0754 family)
METKENEKKQEPVSIFESIKALIAKVDTAKVIKEDELKLVSDALTGKLNERYEEGLVEGKKVADAETAEEIPKLLKKMDEDFTKTLIESVDGVDTAYTKILTKLTERCEKVIKNPIISEKLVTKLSSFIDAYITEAIGEQPVVEVEKAKQLKKFYEDVREAVLVNNEEIQESIAKKTSAVEAEVKQLKESLNEALKAKVTLNEQLNATKKSELIDSKVESLAPIIEKRVREFFKDTSYAEVKESVDSVIKRIQADADKEALTEAKPAPKGKTISESVTNETDSSGDIMDTYAARINQINRFSK